MKTQSLLLERRTGQGGQLGVQKFCCWGPQARNCCYFDQRPLRCSICELMRSENAVSSKKQSWQQEQGSSSGREQAVRAVGSQSQHGREEQRVGGSCWVELNMKGAIWIRGEIRKTCSKSGDGPSFILVCPEGCS